MTEFDFNRRDFMVSIGGMAAAAWTGVISMTPEAPYEFFTPEEARDFDAASAQIIPTDETPGAREARVVRFLDRYCAMPRAPYRQQVRDALGVLRNAARSMPGAPSFGALSDTDQLSLLRTLEQSTVAAVPGLTMTGAVAVRFLVHFTKAGMFSHPMHGGNVNKVGWKMLGYEDRYSWTPPFGDYDRV